MNNMIDMIQTHPNLLNEKLKSSHGRTKETKHKVALTTCELELFYFVDVATTLNEGVDEEF